MKKVTVSLISVIPYIGIWQVGYYFQLNKFLVIVILLFPLFFVKRKDFKLNTSVLLSVFLSIAFLFMLIEPGVAYGKAHIGFTSYDFLQSILYSILFSISLISMIFGVVLNSLWKRPFGGMTLTALIYVFSITPLNLFFNLNGLASLLLFNVSFLVVLSYFLGFLYLKSNRNLLPPLLFLTIYLLFLVTNVNIEVSKFFNLVWEVVSLSVLLFITDHILKESIPIKRAFKSKRVVFRKRDNSRNVIFAGIFIVFFLLVLMPLLTQETHYAIADPTNSMYPVIQPDSLLLVSHIEASQVHTGTVIVFNAPWENGTLYAHQVINITYIHGEEYFVTKGVNNPAKDPMPVPVTDLVGKVSLAIPYAGYALIYSKVTAAVILVIIGVSYFRESRN